MGEGVKGYGNRVWQGGHDGQQRLSEHQVVMRESGGKETWRGGVLCWSLERTGGCGREGPLNTPSTCQSSGQLHAYPHATCKSSYLCRSSLSFDTMWRRSMRKTSEIYSDSLTQQGTKEWKGQTFRGTVYEPASSSLQMSYFSCSFELTRKTFLFDVHMETFVSLFVPSLPIIMSALGFNVQCWPWKW